jgi:ABC-type microcin C transport system duplicated ATPase subunit YejF
MSPAPSAVEPLLTVEGLRVSFGGRVAAVRGASFEVARGETHCVVGESGCGKSVSALAIMNLLVRGAARGADRLTFDGQDLLRLPDRAMARLRGNRMAMIFQEPMTSLNPAYTAPAGGRRSTARPSCWRASASPHPACASASFRTSFRADCASAS